jgi:hypothetical protein
MLTKSSLVSDYSLRYPVACGLDLPDIGARHIANEGDRNDMSVRLV